MASNRIIHKIESDERFVETSPEHWAARLEAWKRDGTQPCPMPVGHRMFLHPREYSAVLESPPESMSLFGAPAVPQEIDKTFRGTGASTTGRKGTAAAAAGSAQS